MASHPCSGHLVHRTVGDDVKTLSRREHLVRARKFLYTGCAIILFHVWTWAIFGMSEKVGVGFGVTAAIVLVMAIGHWMLSA